jgi:hypothetical protein
LGFDQFPNLRFLETPLFALSWYLEFLASNSSGASQSVVNRFVHGERGIRLETAARLCSYLDLRLLPRARR